MLLLEALKYKINTHKIISFDIFDTLLLRPYVRPIDLFLHIERLSNKKGFFNERIKAENNARVRINTKDRTLEDITLDDIYNEIEDNYKDLKQLEIDLETQILQQNHEIFEVFEYAKEQGKKIIITSDMYLNKNILENILNLKGYNGYYKLYVSSDIKKAKATGNLYKYIIDDLKVEGKDILHIGDNQKADIEKAEENNIDTFYYQKISEKFLNEIGNEKFKILLEQNQNNLDISIILGMIILNWHNKENKDILNYWEDFGYNFGGPVCYGFTKFIIEEAKKRNISDLFFIARDGFILNEIYKIIKGDCQAKNHYVYAPRMLKILCLLDYENNESYLDTLFDIFKETLPEYKKLFINKLTTFEEKKLFFEKNKKYFEEFAGKKREEYKKYIQSLNLNGGNIWLADSMTTHFSAQELLNRIFDNSIKINGIYFQNEIYCNSKTFKYDLKYLTGNSVFINFKKDSKIGLLNWDTMELIMTAPELPIKNVEDGKIIYQDNPKLYELIRKNIYEFIYKKEIKFVKDIEKIFSEFQISFEYENIVRLMNALYLNLSTTDEYSFSQIYHSSGSDHKNYFNLLQLIKNNSYTKSFNLFNIFPLIKIRKSNKLTKYKIFNILLFFTKKNKNKSIEYKLFNFITIMKIRKKCNIVYYNLFAFLPIITIVTKEYYKIYKLFSLIPLFSKIINKINN